MSRPDAAEHLPIKPLGLIHGVIACILIAAALFSLLFGFRTIPANSVGLKPDFPVAGISVSNKVLARQHSLPYGAWSNLLLATFACGGLSPFITKWPKC